MARVLVACEYSGRVRNAFAALGHDAWSCDLLESETPGQHYQGDVRDMLTQQWDLMVCHLRREVYMGCTYVSGPGFVGHICHGDHWLSLEPFGAKVWVDDHNWLGPTFYRSEAALRVIENPSKKTWEAYEKWRKTLTSNAMCRA